MSGSERLENVEIDTENNLIVIDGVGIELRDTDGERMVIEHTSGVDGYVAFRKPASVEEATVCFVQPDTDR